MLPRIDKATAMPIVHSIVETYGTSVRGTSCARSRMTLR
jgi:hypothetical protein